MAGRPRIVKSIQSYITKADTNAGIGNLKAGTSPSIGKSHYLWYMYSARCSPTRNDLLANKEAIYKKNNLITQDKSGGFRYSKISGQFRIF
jgi:hypothetical protein